MKIHLQPDAEAATSGTVQRLQERIAELERERDNLLKNREDLLELAMNAATADLRAQLAEAQWDSERLDWFIESAGKDTTITNRLCERMGDLLERDPVLYELRKEGRAAIDDARAAEESDDGG